MKILIVDDEQMQLEMLQGFLEKQGYEISIAQNGREALKLFSTLPFQLVLMDHKMPGLTGDDVLFKMKQINPLIRCMMITAYGSVETAIKVMKLGADDLLEKPVDLKILLDKIHLIEQALFIEQDVNDVKEIMALPEKKEMPLKIIGSSASMKRIISLARRIAMTDWTSLIVGDTGTGKELIARLIHLISSRANNPFIEVNCAAIPENLFESELFGHEKGAFSGASSARRGRFEIAEGGSLFLDEIGELPLNLQAKLLRALQEKKISRLGSEKDIDVDLRIIAATNRDLKKLVEKGLFREDLFFRLSVLDLNIPPLNQRKEDIPELTAYFTEKYSAAPLEFHPDAMAVLMKYSFPGNVRELEHIVQRTIAFTRGTLVKLYDLPSEIRFFTGEKERGCLEDRLLSLEREMILMALDESAWNQTKAAKSLGISERVLRYKLKKHKIKRKTPGSEPS